MNFLDNITKHYLRESKQGFGAAILGGILLIAAFVLFKFAQPFTILRGLLMPFTVGGLVFTIGGSVHGFKIRRAMVKGSALYRMDERAFLEKEIISVERTHRSWRRVFTIWSIITLVGTGLLFTAKQKNLTGVALGTIIVGIMGFMEETSSKSFNEKYYQLVINESQNNRG